MRSAAVRRPAQTLPITRRRCSVQPHRIGRLATVQRIFFNGSNDRDTVDASGLSVPVTMMGRGGDDRLIGGRADDLLDGGQGDDKLEGGRGNDILLGRAGKDKLNGGHGLDLLIVGLGSDNLDGEAEGDLLIAGYTSFDANTAALRAILAEWTSHRDYSTRVANLSGAGAGPRLNGDYFLISTSPTGTIFDDADSDLLTPTPTPGSA